MKLKKKQIGTPLNFLGKLVVIIYALVLTLPLYFVIITAFKTETERVINPIGLPAKLTFENFAIAWEKGNFLQAGFNSIFISTATTILSLLLVIIVAYSLDRIRDTKIGSFLYMVVLSAMFIPAVGTATGLMLRRQLGLYNNYQGEIIVGAFNIATGVFMVSAYLRTMPTELYEAGVIDGASDKIICFRIITPVVKPVLGSLLIITFRGVWNSCTGPLLTIRDPKLYTLPMTLFLKFSSGQSTIYTAMFAGVIMTTVPVIILFIKCQDSFMNALAGGVKG